MNIPNILTLFRIFLIPVFILIFFSNINNSLFIAILIFLSAGLTDILDGYIARKCNLTTKFGTALDPLADKLMLITVLTCLTIDGYIPVWVLIIVATKELFMIIAAIFLYNANTIIPSNVFGKASTLLFYISIFMLSLGISVGHYFLYAAILSAIIAFINYLIIFLKNRGTIHHHVE